MIVPPLSEYTRLRLNSVSLSDACTVLAHHFHITMRELTERHEDTGGLRICGRSNARRSIWWHLRQVKVAGQPKWSYPEIAKEFGVAHSSIIQAVKNIDRSMSNDREAQENTTPLTRADTVPARPDRQVPARVQTGRGVLRRAAEAGPVRRGTA